MKITAVIPARYASSRFPGKPLADICGRPMIWWVYNEAKKVDDFDDVIIATDSPEIIDVCNELGMNARMTSDKHRSGTDRAAEVALQAEAGYYAVILGDEPVLAADDIRKLVNSVKAGVDADMFQLVEKMHDPVDVVNTSTVKMAINDEGYCVYLSRAPIPVPKASIEYNYYKSCGLFIISRDALSFFTSAKRGNLEVTEDIEQLRFIENHKKIYTVTADHISMAVDTPKDLDRVREAIARRVKETN